MPSCAPALPRLRRSGVLLCAATLVVASLSLVSGAAAGAASAPETPARAERAARCTIVGTSGSDRLVGTPDADVICGRGGDDRLFGGGGDDVVRGGRGHDMLVGGRGNDILGGGPGNDRLDGRDTATFRDLLRCGSGRADRAAADTDDQVAADCERVRQNRPPADILLDPASVAENEPAGTLVGRLSVADPDVDDRHTLRLVPGDGSADNDRFVVQGDQLMTAASLDFEAAPVLSVRVRAEDREGAALETSLTVQVVDVAENRAPLAVDDVVAGTEDTRLELPVDGAGSPAANDSDPDGDELRVTGVTGAVGGTVALSGSTISFIPAPDLCGPATGGFDYTVSDGGGATATGGVRIDLTCTRDVPVAVDDTATVAEDSAPVRLAVLANDRNPDGDPLAVTAATDPARGTVALTGGGLTYEPDPGYCNTQAGGAPDTFGYTLTGGTTATVSVTVTCVDDAPVAVADTATVAEDDPASAVDVLGNDTDVDGGPMVITAATDPARGTVALTGPVDARTGLTYEPDADYCNLPPGTTPDTFDYTLNGGDSATVSVTVTCVDDAPVAVDDTATVAEDVAATAVDVLANDTDIDGGAMEVVSATDPANGTVVVTGGGTGLTYEPDADYCNLPPGTTPDTFEYTLNGGDSATVSVTVTCVDDAPVAVDDVATVAEDAAATAVDVLANDTDVDGGTMEVVSATDPANGTVVVTGGGTGLSYRPDADYCNSGAGPDDTFDYTLNGGDSATVSVTVTCDDDAPVAVDDAATVVLDAAASPIDVLANDTDVDAGPMLIASATGPAHGTVVLTGGVAGAHTGLTYRPAPGYCNDPPGTSPDTFDYTLVGGSTATVRVTVVCDVPPVAVADTDTVAEDVSATPIDVLANDTDVDGGPMVIVSATDPTHGTVALTGGLPGEHTGLTYRPDTDYCNLPPGTTPDTFEYTLNGGDSATVSVSVTCVDDRTVAVDDTATVTEDSAANAIDVLANEDDVDGGPRAVASVTDPANGTATVTGGGTAVSYTPDPDYCNDPPGTATDDFDYTLSGPAGSTATVSVTVTCVNDAPVADDETFGGADSAVGNTVLVVDDPSDAAPTHAGPRKLVTGNLLAGDTDPDSAGPLAVTAGTFATNDGGSVVLQADGDFVFTPAPGCSDGSDFFDYTVSDQETPTAGTDTGRVTIELTGCVWYVSNDAPGNAGTSTAPFDTLAQAQSASGPGHTIYVHAGTGTATGYAAGIDLQANQHLVGEVADLQVGGALLAPGVPGARPMLTDNNADVVVLAAGNTVRGLLIDPQGTAGGIAGGTGDAGGTITDVRVVDTGTAGTQPGLELDGTTGTWSVADLVVDNSAATGTSSGSVGVRLNNAGTVTFTAAGTVSIATKGAKGLDATGTALGTSVFDAVTVTGSSSGALSMTNTTGNTTFADLALTTVSGDTGAFVLSAAGTVTVPAAGTANVTAVGGPAVDVTGTAGAALALDTVTSTNSATDGINLVGLGAGTFSAGSGSVVTGATGIGFDLEGGSGDVSFAGALQDGAGATAEVTGRTGGVVTFSGSVIDSGDAGGGISLTGNTGGSTTFSNATKKLDTGAQPAVVMGTSDGHTLNLTGGGLDIDTTSGKGLTATASGTIVVSGTGNTIDTTTGKGLEVVATDVGTTPLTFERISGNGANAGILLSGTGTNAALTVTGSGSGSCVAGNTGGCTGGAIRNTTGADDAGATPGGTGIVLHDTRGISLTRMHLADHANYAIRGSGVVGFTLATSVINGTNGTNGTTPFDDTSVRFDNLTGSAGITDTHVSGGFEDDLRVVNTTGSLNRITLTGVTIGRTGSAGTNDGVLLETSAAAGQLHATITGSSFTSAAGDLLQFNHNGSGTGDLVLTGNTFSNSHPSIATGGGGLTLTGGGASGATTMSITGNSFRDAVGHAVLVVKPGGAGAQTGTFDNNTIGVDGVANSGSLEGSGLKLQNVDGGVQRWTVTNNRIRQYNNFGIDVQGGAGVMAAGTIVSTITGNTIEQPGSSASTAGLSKFGIQLNIGVTPGDSFLACGVITGNNVANSGMNNGDIDIRLRQRQNTTIRLPGYPGTPGDIAAVSTYVNANNGGGNNVSVSANYPTGGGFTGVACP